MTISLEHFNAHYMRSNCAESIEKIIGADHVIDENHPKIQSLIALSDYLLTIDDMNNLSKVTNEKKIIGLQNTSQYRHKLVEVITDYMLDQNLVMDVDVADKLMSHLDSYNRPAFLLQLNKMYSFDTWMKFFVDFWTQCDGCSMYMDELKEIFKGKNMAELMKTYFDADDYKKWKYLKKQFIVYRGAFESCKLGLSWSMDNKVAMNFANQYHNMSHKGIYYMRAKTQMNEAGLERLNKKIGERASLYAIRVRKEDCLLFTSRGEKEVFVPNSSNYMVLDALAGQEA